MSPKAGTFGARDPQLLFHSNAQPYACRAAFSRELLNREGIRFAPGLALGEDVVFQFAAYALARKTVVMPDEFYHYVMESESATHEFNSAEAAVFGGVCEPADGLGGLGGLRSFGPVSRRDDHVVLGPYRV
ncbi:MAG: hypothetical protein BHV61_03650 [Collinsella sp. 60_9]|nr:MAG: hypothetical protein BHV61_03650 [Collinsella sp. 60_9]